jgi:hypothetical protein
MTDSDLKLFQQAVTLARRPEQRPAAYARLKQLERLYPQDMFILIWVAYTSLDSDPTLVEAETALARASQVAASPGDEALLDAYDWLNQKRQLRNSHSKKNRTE